MKSLLFHIVIRNYSSYRTGSFAGRVFIQIMTWFSIVSLCLIVSIALANVRDDPGCVASNLNRVSSKYPAHSFGARKKKPVLVTKRKRVITNISPLSRIRLATKNLGNKSSRCKNQGKITVKVVGKCPNKGTLIGIGCQTSTSFIKQITICHVNSTANTLYSSSILRGASILTENESDNSRSAFRKGSFFKGIDVIDAYKQTTQMATFERILGSKDLAKRYLDPNNSIYLARGHLVPHADFADANGQDMTYYYINCAPQWQAFNTGNWKALEMSVRKLASGRKADFTIYTGTFEILTLTDVLGRQKPITLTENEKIPVPKYYWKIIHDEANGKATAVIGINNPYIRTITGADEFCPNVCNQVAWIAFERTKMSSGYIFCCTVQSLHNKISYSPKLGNLPLLI